MDRERDTSLKRQKDGRLAEARCEAGERREPRRGRCAWTHERSLPRSTEPGDGSRALSCVPAPADTTRGGDQWNSGEIGDRKGLKRVCDPLLPG